MNILDQAKKLAKLHVKLDRYITNIWFSPNEEEVRLVEVSGVLPNTDNITVWRYADAPEIDYPFVTALLLASPEEWRQVEEGALSLPEGWDRSQFVSLYDGEDPRKAGLKKGLRQLNILQLKRVIGYPGEMVLDEVNYQDGKFCPLAVAVGLDRTMQNPSHDMVFQVLTDLGYEVYNTRGIEGKFYTDNRKEDLLEAAQEVLEEKLEQEQ